MHVDQIPDWILATLDAEVGGELRGVERWCVERSLGLHLLVEGRSRLPDGRPCWQLVALAMSADRRTINWWTWKISTSRRRAMWAVGLLGVSQVDPRVTMPFGFLCEARDCREASGLKDN